MFAFSERFFLNFEGFFLNFEVACLVLFTFKLLLLVSVRLRVKHLQRLQRIKSMQMKSIYHLKRISSTLSLVISGVSFASKVQSQLYVWPFTLVRIQLKALVPIYWSSSDLALNTSVISFARWPFLAWLYGTCFFPWFAHCFKLGDLPAFFHCLKTAWLSHGLSHRKCLWFV